MNTFTKIAIGFIAIEIIFAGLIYTTYANVSGFYIPIINRAVCSDKHSCLHEVGHIMDRDNGNVSETKEFRDAVQLFRIVADTNNAVDEMSYRIRKFPGIGSDFEQTTCGLLIECGPEGWGGYSELYPEIYAMAGGNINNIPPGLQRFYQ